MFRLTVAFVPCSLILWKTRIAGKRHKALPETQCHIMSTSTNTTNTSTQSVVTAILFNGIVFLAFVCAFLLLRMKFLRIYQPKSSFNLINDEKKPDPLPNGIYQWVLPLIKKSDNFVIRQAGLDGYFFLRYLILISSISLFFVLLFFPILLPINRVDGAGNSGLDAYTFANVGSKSKYYAHALLSLVFYLSVLYVVYRELTYYTSVRQAVLSSPRYGKKLSSRVVLFQTVPEQYLDENEFAKLFDDVKKVWVSRAAKAIDSKVEERDDLAYKLENALNQLLKKAVKKRFKAQKKDKEIDNPHDINEYVSLKNRPKHKLKFLIGKKVDTIDYAKEKLVELNKEVHELQASHRDAKPINSVFVEFGCQYSAQLAFQSVAHHTALHLSPRYIGLEPKDINWINMRLFWWERLTRKFGAAAAIIAVVLFWSIPVTFVGMVSNITYLTNKIKFLGWINDLPKVILGVITSFLPTIALSVLMMILPKFIRFMAKVSGAPSYQFVEYYTQQSYFAFQVIQVFLVTTLASSASSAVTQIIEEPTSAMKLLSQNLPKASNFYISYIILQGFTLASGVLLQLVNLILFYVLGALLDTTTRKKWHRFNNLTVLEWGTVFPIFTNLAVISITYAIISPFVLLFSAVGFGLIYVAYLYNLCYTYSEGPDSRGIHYPRALFQTIVGVYLGEICLLGLFVVSKAWGPIVIEAIVLGFTVFVHINLNAAFDQLVTVVPVDAMRPLDGKSDTPSYTNKFKAIKANGSPNSAFNRLSRDSGTLDKNSSYRSDGINVELEDLNELSMEHIRKSSSVPLLADGDKSLVPPAPFWKRFLKPHIYSSYKVAKTRIPDIYNYADPNELTDPYLIEHAYDFPAVSAKSPFLWIPRDPYGWSAELIDSFKGIIDISDEGSNIDEKGVITWHGPPPKYEQGVEPGLIYEKENLPGFRYTVDKGGDKKNGASY